MQVFFFSFLLYLPSLVFSSFVEISSQQKPLLLSIDSSSSLLLSYDNVSKNAMVTALANNNKIYELLPVKNITDIDFYSFEAKIKKVNTKFIFVYGSPAVISIYSEDFSFVKKLKTEIKTENKAYSISDIISLDNKNEILFAIINQNSIYAIYVDITQCEIKKVIAISEKANGGFCDFYNKIYDAVCVVPDVHQAKLILINKEKYKIVNVDKGDVVSREFNFLALGKVIDEKNILSCFYSYFGTVKCGIITIANEEEIRSNFVNEEIILEKCDNVYFRTFTVEKITNNKYAISCIDDDDIIIKVITVGNGKIEQSKIIKEETGWGEGNINYLSLLTMNNQINFVFYYDNKIWFKEGIIIPTCINGTLEYFIDNSKESDFIFDYYFYNLTNLNIYDTDYYLQINNDLFEISKKFTLALPFDSLSSNLTFTFPFSISNSFNINSDTCSLSLIISFLCYESCETCSHYGTAANHYCIDCKVNYFLFNGSNCYAPSASLVGYYFNEISEQFQPCSETCYTCYSHQEGNDTNCFICREGYVSHPKDESTCVKQCDSKKSRWYLDANEYKCTDTLECPIGYPIYNEKLNKCSSSCEDETKPYQYNLVSCVDKCPNETYIDEGNKRCFNKPKQISTEDIDDLILALPKQTILLTQNGTVYIYESSLEGVEKAKELAMNNNLSYIDFEECISVLKNVWNIDEDQNLYVAQIEVNRTTQVTNRLDYAIYRENGQKLDLSVCSNLNLKVNYYITDVSNISLETAKALEEKGIDIYNGKDDFFNSYCVNFTSEYNTDVILKDRREHYFKNVSYCEVNCSYLHINLDTHRVECACPVKGATETEEDEDKNENPPDFSSEITSSNYEVIVCYNQVFNKEKLKVNIGNYIFLGMGAVIIGIFCQYAIYGKRNIMKYIIANNVNGEKLFVKKRSKKGAGPPKKRTMLGYQTNNFISKNNISNNKSEIEESVLVLNTKNVVPSVVVKNQKTIFDLHKQEFIQNKSILNSISNTKKNDNCYFSATLDNLNSLSNDNNIPTCASSKKTTTDFLIGPNSRVKKKKNKKEKETKCTSLDYEEMTFETAILIDHRNFLETYKELILSKHIFFCLIWNKGILLKQIKFSVFVINTATDFFFNAFFYSDEYIAQSFSQEGELEYLVTLPKSIVSFLATALFSYFLEYLTSSKFLVMLVRSEFKEKFFSQCNSFINMLQCKIKVYISISIFIMCFFWYYVSAFCAVYQNSQISWITSTFLSFGLSIVTPFATTFAACLSRLLGLRYKSKCWFRISGIILFLT